MSHTDHSGSTPNPASGDVPIEIVDGRQRDKFGIVYMDDIDSPEFRELSPRAVRVYIALACFTSRRGREAWPSQKLLGEITGQIRQTVNAAVAELVEAELLHKREVGRRLTYTLLVPPSQRVKS